MPGGRYERALIENDIEKHYISQCRKRKLLQFKFVSPGITGVPDRFVISNGHVYFAELKRPGENRRPDQIARGDIMSRHGADISVIDSYESVEAHLDRVVKETRS